MNDVIREFLLETHENLAQLDSDLIALEQTPRDRDILARVFRTLHSVKGTAGFIGLMKLQAIAHAAESLLSRLRAGELIFNQPIANAVLGVVDAIRQILQCIEQNHDEGDGDYTPLIADLEHLRITGGVSMVGTTVIEPKVLPPVPTPSLEPATPPPPVPEVKFESRSFVGTPPPSPSPTVSSSDSTTTIINRDSDTNELQRPSSVSDSSIRVDVGLLDKLMNLVGELVLARNQIMQYSGSLEDSGFISTAQRLNLLTTELQANVMKTRMQPIGNVWSKFPRIVRDLAVACGKQVRIEMEGQETELDKTIIEAIRDPLTHMIRNAVDHGIESPDVRSANGKPIEGRLTLHAYHEGGKVIIVINDDGGGIDPIRVRDKAIRSKLISSEEASRYSDRELLNLIFLPGFSTADQVTHFSGRGVGMDVVRTNIERIGGTVELESRVGRGTSVKMKIPLTLAIIPALTVSTSGDRYCIPQVNLLELVRLDGEHITQWIETVHGAPVYRLRGNLLPLVFLDEQLQVESNREVLNDLTIVVLQADERQFGLVVDMIHDTEEIVVKPLQKQIKSISVFAGATIMGDGRVALILDVVALAQRANVVSASRGRSLGEQADDQQASESQRESLLLFSNPDGGRMAIPLAQVARLEEFHRDQVERAGSRQVVQYRGEILPLIDVATELRRLGRKSKGDSHTRKAKPISEAAKQKQFQHTEPLEVVVYANANRRVGLVVDSIIDIVEEDILSQTDATRDGVLFTAVVQGKVTEFLDVERIIRS